MQVWQRVNRGVEVWMVIQVLTTIANPNQYAKPTNVRYPNSTNLSHSLNRTFNPAILSRILLVNAPAFLHPGIPGTSAFYQMPFWTLYT